MGVEDLFRLDGRVARVTVIARASWHRLGGEEDLTSWAVCLAREASRHIAGQYLAVDGGSSIVV